MQFIRRLLQAEKPYLVVADEGTEFYVHDSGLTLADLFELQYAFEHEITDAQFQHHQDRGDFAQWIADILDDRACAADVAVAATREQAADAIAAHLRKYA